MVTKMLRVPRVMDGEDSLTRNHLSLFLSELATPRDSFIGSSAFTSVVVLQIAGCLHCLRAPLVPALGQNLTGQFAIHEEGIAVIAPWTAQINLVNIGISYDTTVVEDVAVRNILWCGGGSDIGVGLAEDVAVLKPSCGGTKDKVGGAFDVAVVEEEARLGITCIDGVLMSQKTTVDEGQTVAFGMQGNSLSQSGGIVFDGDVLQRDATTLYLEGKSAESTYLLRIALSRQWGDVSQDVGVIVPSDNGVVTVFTVDLNVGQPLGDNEFLLVSAFLNEDDLVVFHKGTTHLDSIADVTELACAIAADHEGVRIVIVLGLYAHESNECTDSAENFLHFIF